MSYRYVYPNGAPAVGAAPPANGYAYDPQAMAAAYPNGVATNMYSDQHRRERSYSPGSFSSDSESGGEYEYRGRMITRETRCPRDVVRAPTPPPIIKRVVERAPTPEAPVMERVIIRPQAQEIVERVIEQPRTPPPRIIQKEMHEQAPPPIVRTRVIKVDRPLRSGYSQPGSPYGYSNHGLPSYSDGGITSGNAFRTHSIAGSTGRPVAYHATIDNDPSFSSGSSFDYTPSGQMTSGAPQQGMMMMPQSQQGQQMSGLQQQQAQQMSALQHQQAQQMSALQHQHMQAMPMMQQQPGQSMGVMQQQQPGQSMGVMQQQQPGQPTSVMQQQQPGQSMGVMQQQPAQSMGVMQQQPMQQQPMQHQHMQVMPMMQQQPVQSMGVMHQQPVQSMGVMHQQPVQTMPMMQQQPVQSINGMQQQPMQSMGVMQQQQQHMQPMAVVQQQPVQHMSIMQQQPVQHQIIYRTSQIHSSMPQVISQSVPQLTAAYMPQRFVYPAHQGVSYGYRPMMQQARMIPSGMSMVASGNALGTPANSFQNQQPMYNPLNQQPVY